MDKKKTEELNEQGLDQVIGGAGGKQLIGHELTHVQQQGDSKYIGETEKNLSRDARHGKQAKPIAAGTGDGSI